MGKRRKGGKNKEGGQKRQRGERRERGLEDKPHIGWDDYVLESAAFETYYKAQGIVPEEEWDTFIKTLKKPLPTTFRITEISDFADDVKRRLQEVQNQGPVTLDDGTVIEPPKALPWYPNNGGWYYNISKKGLKKNPELEHFHRFLTAQTESGNISRQEAVSMLPPIFLKVEPHHKVLDMCAAPGSKTAQIVEALHANQDPHHPPTGLVVANDADYDRCYTLIHQIKRFQSPCVMVTNHDAQRFPFIKTTPLATSDDSPANKEGLTKEGKVSFQFDRVLCDVPCSGDGTMRKNPDIWAQWGVAKAIGVHRLQVSIAARGINLLKVGGRMVYSTCSLNPVEDEAVVAELLRQFKGQIKLVDVSNELPQMKRLSGVSTWKIQDRDGKWYNSPEDIPRDRKKKVATTIFPPTAEEAQQFELHKSMRLLPHHQDTGGFFVAVIEKIAPTWKEENPNKERNEAAAAAKAMETSSTSTATTTATSTTSDNNNNNNAETTGESGKAEENPEETAGATSENKMARRRKTPEAPFLPFQYENNPTWDGIRNYFGVPDDFPADQMFVRSEKSVKITYVSKSIKELFTADERESLKIINTGVRVFNKQDLKTVTLQYRLAHEGLQYIYPFITKRRVVIQEPDLCRLLEEKEPLFTSLTQHTGNQLSALDQGSILMVIDPRGRKPWAGMMLTAWRAKTSCHLQIPKEDVKALLQIAKEDNILKTYLKAEEEKLTKEEEKPAEEEAKKEEVTAN